VFRVEGRRAVLARTADLLDLAGAVEVADEPVLLRTLEVYEVHRLDFADAYLVAEAETSGVNAIASFDRAIERVPTVRRVAPA
jgi:predicted nucleic acid-binding protein